MKRNLRTRITIRLVALVAALGMSTGASAAVSIDAVYFGQSHVQKPDNPYFGLVSNRDALIKAHVVDPATPSSPAVTATLTLDGQNLNLPMSGPATLPASIPDGLGVVQHSYSDSFTAIIPAAWVQPGLEINVTADTASVDITNLEIGAPTRVIMRMFDVHYFGQTTGDYPAGWQEELEAKWPVAELELRRLPQVVFPELVIPPRAGLPAARITSPADYQAQTGQGFDGEQAAALAWNGALKRAGGRSGRIHLSYINIYGVNAGGQAGGFSGVGNGTSVGILHHELGHALSLPHWGDNGAYPYKGAMHGIQPPANYNETHAGPAWAFDLRTEAFIPCTVQSNNVGGRPEGTYKVDPMQGGGSGYQEPAYLMNHFSDYSMNQMRNYLEGHVLVWNETLGSYASWNQAAADYTNPVSNNGVQYPIERDVDVITLMASVSGANPDVNMVYPPIGPYTAGLIKLFDPRVPADRTEAQAIFAPAGGCDVSLRIMQGGMEKIYMLAASWEPGADPLSGGSLKTEGVNLPASDGEVTLVELILTPDAEDNGLPADPEVLYTWAPVTPDPASFELVPTAGSSSAISMRATAGTSTGDPVEYLFTETTGNTGGSSSGWQSSRAYTDTGLQPATPYAYTITMRAGTYTGRPSGQVYETTNATGTAGTITVDSTQQFSLQSGGGLQPVTGLGAFDAAGADKLVVVVSTEHGFNNGDGYVTEVRYNGLLMTEVVQEDAGVDRGTAAMFYLDNPGPIGAGTIEVSAANPNGGIGAAYALSGTAASFGATNTATGDSVTSVSLTTSGDNVIVIAALDNAGNSNGAGTPTALAPLTPVSSGFWGSQWGSHASGYQMVATPSTVTPSFSTNTGAGYSINIIAAEFLAEPIQSDTTPPTLAGSDIVDDQGGGPVTAGDTVTYTVTFSEAMDPSTVDAGDFENGGSAPVTVLSASPTGDAAVFEVAVRPEDAGQLRLQVQAGASLEDLAGNPLDTTSPIADDTILTVNGDTTAPTLVSIDDDVGGGPIADNDIVTYTVTFDEAMNASTIEVGDFENGGSPPASINSVNATADPAVFEVAVRPGGAGTLQLQIKAGANLEDLAGNPLDTSSALADPDVIIVTVAPPTGEITVDGSHSWDRNSDPGTFDAGGSDKLVVVVTGEHNFSGNLSGNVTGITYNGQTLTKAVEESPADPAGGGHGQTTADIWYLDNPVVYPGPGTIDVSFTGNNWVVTAIGLSGTVDGVAATAHVSGAASVDLTTTTANSLVIASIGMGGEGNTANVNAVNPNSPLTEISALEIGSNWSGHVTASASVASPGLGTYSFDTANTDVVTIAAVFEPVVAPPSDYDLWSAQYPGSDLSDPDADLDGDGRSNNEERIWGLDPTTGASVSPIFTSLDPGTGAFSYTRRDDALTGLGFTVWTSTDLETWTEDTGAGQVPGLPDVNGVETVAVTISPGLLANPKLFVQVRAE